MVPGWFFIVSGDFFKMFFFHGSRLVFCDYRSVFMVFDNSKLVSIVFHCSRLAFHSEFHCFFAALDWFTIPWWFLWFQVRFNSSWTLEARSEMLRTPAWWWSVSWSPRSRPLGLPGWLWPSAYDGYNEDHLDNDNEDSEGHDENDANQKSNVILKAEAIKNISKSTTDPRVERSWRRKYRNKILKVCWGRKNATH